MHAHQLLIGIALMAALVACSDSNNNQPTASSDELNPTAAPETDDGKGGGNTTNIAGLWNGTTTQGDISDVVYWVLSDNGVLTRYDFQQDGVQTATGENCYSVGNPISVFPEGDNNYSIFNVTTTTVINEDTLTITFIDADINDLDNDGDTSETPTLNWSLLTTPSIDDLNACTQTQTTQDAENQTDGAPQSGEDQSITIEIEESTASGDANNGEDTPGVTASNEPEPGISGGIPFDNSNGTRPLMTRAECKTAGGNIIGDIDNGAIHRPEYRCESGEPPVARITYLEGEPISSDGEVCCL